MTLAAILSFTLSVLVGECFWDKTVRKPARHIETLAAGQGHVFLRRKQIVLDDGREGEGMILVPYHEQSAPEVDKNSEAGDDFGVCDLLAKRTQCAKRMLLAQEDNNPGTDPRFHTHLFFKPLSGLHMRYSYQSSLKNRWQKFKDVVILRTCGMLNLGT